MMVQTNKWEFNDRTNHLETEDNELYLAFLWAIYQLFQMNKKYLTVQVKYKQLKYTKILTYRCCHKKLGLVFGAHMDSK